MCYAQQILPQLRLLLTNFFHAVHAEKQQGEFNLLASVSVIEKASRQVEGNTVDIVLVQGFNKGIAIFRKGHALQFIVQFAALLGGRLVQIGLQQLEQYAGGFGIGQIAHCIVKGILGAKGTGNSGVAVIAQIGSSKAAMLVQMAVYVLIDCLLHVLTS